MKNNIFILCFFLFAAVGLSAESDSPSVPAAPEVASVTHSARIGVAKIIMKIPVGTIWAKITSPSGTREIPWKSSSVQEQGQFRSIAEKLLKNHGYDVIEDIDNLFGAGTAEKARFQIAGIISSLLIEQEVRSGSAGGCITGASYAYTTNVTMKAEWQIYDTVRDKIMLKIHTSGYYFTESEQDLEVIIFDTFKDAFLRLMAEKDFVNVCTSQTAPDEHETKYAPLTVHYVLDGDKTVIPSGISNLFKSVVTIKVGVTHGTGMIISPDGYILTAAHVVDGTDKVAVIFESGEQTEATVVRIIRTNDAALIKINKKNLPFIPLAKSQPPIGSEVYAIGTPLDKMLSYSVTKGIISGYRERDNIKYIQTDTPVNPGNSGGPLIDGNGYIIGIISSKLMGPGVESIGFAIPVTEALAALNITN